MALNGALHSGSSESTDEPLESTFGCITRSLASARVIKFYENYHQRQDGETRDRFATQYEKLKIISPLSLANKKAGGGQVETRSSVGEERGMEANQIKT